MSPATAPPGHRDEVRLLEVDPRRGSVFDHPFRDLPELLEPGDLLVVNDAATLPASLRGELERGGPRSPVELRLLGPAEGSRWRAVLFGSGDWQLDTDLRPPPPRVEIGDAIELRGGLVARIDGRPGPGDRLVELSFDREGPELWAGLYAAGRPVQYSHLREALELWSVQTVFAGRPWAVEMPSAGRPLTWSLIRRLRRRGVELARLTHAAGLSATGEPELDAALPLPERYSIPAATVAAIEASRARGGRIIAVGTTVVRALESAALEGGGRPRAGAGWAKLIITGERELELVDGLLTGMHDPSESHYRLLQAFAPARVLEAAWSAALEAGYRSHEFGDTALILPGRQPTPGWTTASRSRGAAGGETRPR